MKQFITYLVLIVFCSTLLSATPKAIAKVTLLCKKTCTAAQSERQVETSSPSTDREFHPLLLLTAFLQ
jgi:hypothetical protein